MNSSYPIFPKPVIDAIKYHIDHVILNDEVDSDHKPTTTAEVKETFNLSKTIECPRAERANAKPADKRIGKKY